MELSNSCLRLPSACCVKTSSHRLLVQSVLRARGINHAKETPRKSRLSLILPVGVITKLSVGTYHTEILLLKQLAYRKTPYCSSTTHIKKATETCCEFERVSLYLQIAIAFTHRRNKSHCCGRSGSGSGPTYSSFPNDR
jgi:hypothetical protein